MKWFDTFVSNTLGGTGNQLFFRDDAGAARIGRIYYRIFHGGRYRYSLLFSNIIDSTYKVEYGSYCNLVCDEWEILRVSVGVCKAVTCDMAGEVGRMTTLTFDGSPRKRVRPGEFFASDPVELEFGKGDYLCCEIEFRGGMYPYHLESILPTFRYEDGRWIPDKRVPAPGMIGCGREVELRIGYFGDSITQGIGTPPNAYTHWCALVSEALGERYSYWNLGLGYGRGQDAATGGAWFYKASRCDALVVTFGANDVGRGRTVEQMKTDFSTLIDRLKARGKKVFLQTVPPFDWQGDYFVRYEEINRFLVDELAEKADGFLDVAPLLTDEARGPGMSKYGKHPDETGCRIWAEKLIPLMKEFISK